LQVQSCDLLKVKARNTSFADTLNNIVFKMLRLNRALNLASVSKLVMRNNRAFGGSAHGHGDKHGHSDGHGHGDGHGHDDHHHDGSAYQPVYHPPPPGPYDAPHEHIDRTKAFMFGEDPAHPKEAEGWETITYLTYFACFSILCYSLYTKGQDPLRDWAKKEAIAREKAAAKGEKIQYGVFLTDSEHHTLTEFSKEGLGSTPESVQK